MFDFGVLVSILCAIIIFYFSTTSPLNEKMKDLLDESYSKNDAKAKEIKHKYHTKQQLKRTINIVTTILILVVLLLYYAPYLNLSLTPSGFIAFFSKILPFKKGFFTNYNFKFSYITETILMFIVALLFFLILIWSILENKKNKTLLALCLTTILIWGLVWVNYFISTFLSYCIIHCFELLSIILNILCYIIIAIISFILAVLID